MILIDTTSKQNPSIIYYDNPGMNQGNIATYLDYIFISNSGSTIFSLYRDKLFVVDIDLLYIPTKIFISRSYLYIISVNSELIIYDISNPTNPIFISVTPVGNFPSEIFVNNYVFINSNDTVISYDVSDIYNVKTINSSNTDISPISIFSVNRMVYVVNNVSGTMQIFEITSKPEITHIASLVNFHSPVPMLGAY